MTVALPDHLFSQPATGQDSWVIETLREKREGYFVEFGGHDGIKHSNTLALETLFNWNGLLVEPDPDLYDIMIAARPDCQHDNRCVSNVEDHEVRFSKGGEWGGQCSFLPPAWQREAQDRKTPEIWVGTVRLSTLLRHHHAPAIVDYLSVDTEGSELAILREYFNGFQPCKFRCLTVEYHQDAGILMQLRRVMEPHGYELDKVRAWESFWTRKELSC